MNATQVPELHYILPMVNLPSVLSRGLLSHNRAANVPHVSVAMPVIQSRRTQVVIPGGRALHDHVNLYINARNKMMYKLIMTTNVADLCVLRVDAGVMNLPNAVIADQNAASGHARFRPSPAGLAHLKHAEVFAQYWTDPDPIQQLVKGSKVCAEVLVPNRVDPAYITGAHVATAAAQVTANGLAPNLSVVVTPGLFFA